MPRRDEALEGGRIAGIIKRKDPELWEQIKRKAEEMGVSVSELLVNAVRGFILYEEYKDVDGATIMKVLDILDRIYNYMEGWRRKSTLEEWVDMTKSLEEITHYMAPRLGYITQEELKDIEKKVRERVERELIERYSSTGRIGGVLDKLIDRLVDQIASSIVEKLEKGGILEDLARIAAQATEETIEVQMVNQHGNEIRAEEERQGEDNNRVSPA